MTCSMKFRDGFLSFVSMLAAPRPFTLRQFDRAGSPGRSIAYNVRWVGETRPVAHHRRRTMARKGLARGKLIELDEALPFPEAQPVNVSVEPAAT